MDRKREFPNFWESFAEGLVLSAKRIGVLAYIPWYLALCAGLSVTFAVALQFEFAPSVSATDAIAALSAMVIVGGLLIAVSVACMTQIYTSVADPQFGDYLKTEKVLDQFLFWPQLTLLIQIIFVACAVASIFVSLTTDSVFIRLVTLSTTTGLLLYVATKTWNLVDTLRLLSWHRQEYESLRLQFNFQQQRTNSNVGRVA